MGAALVSSLLAGVAAVRAESNGFPRRLTTAVVPTSAASLVYSFGLYGGTCERTHRSVRADRRSLHG